MGERSSKSVRLRRMVCNVILIGIYIMMVAIWSLHDSFGLFAFALVLTLAMLAFISWLYNEELMRSLEQAKRSRLALLEQKNELERKLEAHTAELQRSQIEEMRQFYRFTELGQFGIMLLHDIANQLTSLSIEVEDLQRSAAAKDIARIRQITRYLEELIDSTRDRFYDGTQAHTFDILQRTTEVIAFLRYKATKASVIIEWQPPHELWKYRADPLCYSQIITIIINNALDAYLAHHPTSPSPHERKIAVSAHRTEQNITIIISDWAGGISKKKQSTLFTPFQSTKKTGLGIGLFIAKQTIELNFGGTIDVTSRGDHVAFTITLPAEAPA